MKKKFLLSTLILLLTGCTNSNVNPQSFICPGFFEGMTYHAPLNTVVSITMYDKVELNEVSSIFQNKVYSLHKMVDAYSIYKDINNIFTINNNPNTKVKVDDSLVELIKKGIELTKLTNGKMNILTGSVIDIWKEKFDQNEVINEDPDEDNIKEALKTIPSYESIDEHLIVDEKAKEITLIPLVSNNYYTNINLGALSKGYVLDQTSYLFKDKSSIVSAGSSSLHLDGVFPGKERDYYSIGLKEPAYYNKEGQSTQILTIKVDGGNNISTSGDYEKYFITTNEYGDSVFRSHIINPDTGYSSNYHAQICLISKADGVILDALSTALINIKDINEIKTMIKSFEDYYNIIISYAIFDRILDTTYRLSCNQLFKDSILGQYSSSIKEINII